MNGPDNPRATASAVARLAETLPLGGESGDGGLHDIAESGAAGLVMLDDGGAHT